MEDIKEEFIKLYEKGYDDIDISKELNCSDAKVRKIRTTLNLSAHKSIDKYKETIIKFRRKK